MSKLDWERARPHKIAELSATVLPDGRWLLYHTTARTAITLNAPAGILWELCDGQMTVAAILEELHILYPDVSTDLLRSETEKMLDTLVEQGLVTYNEV